jgi:transposase
LGRTRLSRKELDRVEAMGRVKAGSLRLVEAAELLGLSYRQTKRIWRRFRERGSKALQHGNCCRRSNRAYSAGLREQVLKRVREQYGDFGPTLASEHLGDDDGLAVHSETLRRWMRQAGIGTARRRRKPYRQRRERKAHFGELVQMDGSFHRWLEDRAGEGCLMHMVDDATSTALAAFTQEETTWAAADLLRRWIERYGVPCALYTDWKNVYVRAATEREQRDGTVPLTQFGRMCQRLGIRIIPASSPQAKGRVERAHGTHQDRLVKKLRVKAITSYEEANRYLDQHYLAEHNRRYARPAASPTDYHRQRPTARQLDAIFWLEEERVLSADWVVSYRGRLLQVERQSRHHAPAKGRVVVRENQTGDLQIHYRGQRLPFRELEKASARMSGKRGAAPSPAPSSPKPTTRRIAIPAANHPWKRSYLQMRTPIGASAWS